MTQLRLTADLCAAPAAPSEENTRHTRRGVTAPEPAPTVPVKHMKSAVSGGDKPLLCLGPAQSMGKAPSVSSRAAGLSPVSWTRVCGCPGESSDAPKQEKAAVWAESRLNPRAAGLLPPGVRSQLGCKRPLVAGGGFWSPACRVGAVPAAGSGSGGTSMCFAERCNSCFQTANKC